MKLDQAARDLIGEGANATIVTVNPSGTPNVSVVWVALNSTPDGDEIVAGHLGEHIKVRNLRLNPLAVLTIMDPNSWAGYVRPYLKLTGTATIEEGGAPELLTRLAAAVGNPDPAIVFPPADAPPGFLTRIRIDKVGGTGPWTARTVRGS
ncbi:TIGR03618 family F420-dependent PPOX class oxidoreductase [Mycobacterium hodleri]|uniref:TIGR03618 family F420-dependent PPOX class oxidoreductase n=1 Tax=Mycolicibacterium hodleri TaxID=49897 RepID=UPI0021F2DEBB|nr:TIGR03618 family F420-dependent PPOX class oxidoreductase [Mycolicibacterium hodleri]MCV7134928.1 TIGR03618 family F420-dependent PPOX class oxidoreductase [Mycolicibacterium hodleri]